MGASASKSDSQGSYQWKAYVQFENQRLPPAARPPGSADANMNGLNSSGPPSVSSPVLDSIQTSPEVRNTLRPVEYEETLKSPDKKLTSDPLQTDASRAKLIEKQIQNRVSDELKKVQKRQAEALTAAHETIAAAADQFKPKDGEKKETDSIALGKEVDALRKQLESRKQVRELPESVEKARSEVVRCLRENDRRPLDCWQEVETFKAEVKKLEKTWVDKVTA